ncbi:hypothetical protein [Clostridium grantii]|uniref:Uncharacterized protein n=1 Tax=Clostridium grantii DSM 8605 TaxID=1121316 RepID=A0A1M5RC86_9CLOT|nr:hypothetical protein [Clostridium grantii]SHH23881.1 hypothetical protein SAMN02745207_00449 [Clostridium grantii DSM 8605]
MLQRCFNSSPFEAINSAYPNKFKAWELPKVPRCFWDSKENCVAALNWLVTEKLNISLTDKSYKLKRTDLYIHRLSSLSSKYTIKELKEFL